MTVPSIARQFQESFGHTPQLTVRSPGRVNLIGDHTDYHDGLVLPAAIDLATDVAVGRRDDGQFRVVAARLNQMDEFARADLDAHAGPDWSRYVRGCVILLGSAGVDLGGADVVIGGDLPIGGGLSSSASLELGICVALLGLSGSDVDRRALARLCQRVENDIVGVQSGIMDQLAVACGVVDHALMIDCRTLVVAPVPIPDSVRILVLDSGVPRTLAGSAYNERRTESAAALATLQSAAPGLVALRDVTPELLTRHQHLLDSVQLRRARHVVSENERVSQSAAALGRGDIDTFGRLMTDSHASLRDDYEVSVPELDILVATALKAPGVYGARLTGAGFGGCVVALVDTSRAEEAAAQIGREYGDRTGRRSTAMLCRADRGAHVEWTTSSELGS